jgi:hypothetical protein
MRREILLDCGAFTRALAMTAYRYCFSFLLLECEWCDFRISCEIRFFIRREIKYRYGKIVEPIQK